MGAITLRVAVWTVATETFDWPPPHAFEDKSLDDRLEKLTEAVNIAKTWFESKLSGSPTLDIFAAPENLFTVSPSQQLLTVRDKLKIEDALATLSTGILLLPGTVAWYKSVYSPQDELAKPKDTTAPLRRLDKLRVRAQAGTVSKDTLARIEANSDSARMALNTAYVFQNGKRIFKYHKRNEHGEVLKLDRSGAEVVEFIAGNDDGMFDINVGTQVVRAGIEICADQNSRYLKKATADLDLQFLLSAQIFLRTDALALKQGGYAIHACSDRDKSGVYSYNYPDAKDIPRFLDKASGNALHSVPFVGPMTGYGANRREVSGAIDFFMETLNC